MALLVVVAAGLVFSVVCRRRRGGDAAVEAPASGPLEAADEASAMVLVLAHKSRKPVLVTGMTTQTSMEWA
ncbi:hypothetical protein ACGFIE_25420 [Micromonospora sp. NPDC049275]|uniref:hypothetical protein n=1 Tax=Micromonospora sp. NPDC049275 TaxID=3364268 RepID=UPI00371FB904